MRKRPLPGIPFNTPVRNMSKSKRNKKHTGGRRGGPPAAALKPVCWSELDTGLEACRARFQVLPMIQPLLANEQVTAALPQSAEVLERAEIIRRDIATYETKLQRIAARHQGREGVCSTPDQLMEMLSIGEEYEQLSSSFDSIVQPNLDFILNAYINAPSA